MQRPYRWKVCSIHSLMTYADNGLFPAEKVLQLKVVETVMCLLQMNPQFCPILFNFTETWKIDLPDFMGNDYTEKEDSGGFEMQQ